MLVNNAGVSSRGAGLETSLDTDRRVMEVNYFGTIAFTKGTRVCVCVTIGLSPPVQWCVCHCACSTPPRCGGCNGGCWWGASGGH